MAQDDERLKRVLDLALSVPGFVVSLPLQAVIAAAVRLTLGRPVLFRQVRPGQGGAPFELLKFRTMLTPEQAGGRLEDGDRLTCFGRWLRETSLDELPSLWNVIRGDMSLVGPRPLLMEYLPHYTHEQQRRHEVRPGLTGLAQINGRNQSAWEERLALDVEYVDRRNMRLDLKILARTILPVLTRRGISAAGEATMPRFAPAMNKATT